MKLNKRLLFLALFLVMTMPLIAFAHDAGAPYTDNAAGGGTDCTVCHTGNGDPDAPQIDLSLIGHPGGPGTPMAVLLVLGNNPSAISAACVTCHRVSPAVPMADLNDYSCGGCHGSTSTVATTGDIIGGSAALTVASAADLLVGHGISIAGAGAFGTSLDTYIISISGNNIALAEPALLTVSTAAVTQTYGGASTMDPAYLAGVAVNMHALSAPGTLIVGTTGAPVISGFTASFTDASSPGATISINWGDGGVSAGISGDDFAHTYQVAGTYYIIHTASLNNQYASETLMVTVPGESVTGTNVEVTVNGVGGPLADVSLFLKQNGIARMVGATDSAGMFTFTDVSSGEYDVVAYQYGVLLNGNTAPGVEHITVDGLESVVFTQTQTKYDLTVATGLAGSVVTIKQAGVTKSILRTPTPCGGVGQDTCEVTIHSLTAGTYSVDAFMVKNNFSCAPSDVIITNGGASPGTVTCTATPCGGEGQPVCE